MIRLLALALLLAGCASPWMQANKTDSDAYWDMVDCRKETHTVISSMYEDTLPHQKFMNDCMESKGYQTIKRP